MRLRPLGRTGLDVSECSLGLGGLRQGEEMRAALALALDRGVNAAELAAADAQSAGALLRGEAARNLHIFSRVTSRIRFDLPSPHIPADKAYPGRLIRAETETLLKTLGIERLALQQIQAWCPEWQAEGDWLETLIRLREEGKIAGIGVSVFDHDADSALEIAASGAIDAVQVMYNIFDPGAAEALLPLCRKHGLGAIARSPLYYGALREGGPGERDDWRSDYFFDEHRRETAERVARLESETDGPVANLALRFALSHPAVSTVAVGMRTRAQVDANLQAIERGPLPAGQLARLAGHKWLC